jgi:hypothetical protein
MKTLAELRKERKKVEEEVEESSDSSIFPDSIDPLSVLRGPDSEGEVRIKTYPTLHPREWKMIL